MFEHNLSGKNIFKIEVSLSETVIFQPGNYFKSIQDSEEPES